MGDAAVDRGAAGVKAFDRAHKQVTYTFNDETSSLNVAGWTYAKPDAVTAPRVESEPTLK